MHFSLIPETIFHIGTFSVTNTLLMAWLAIAVLAGAAFFVSKKGMRLIPKGLQNAAEAFIEGIFKIIDGVIGDRKLAEKIFPLVATIFIFILFSNWLGILPGIGTVGFKETHSGEKPLIIPFFRSTYSDLNMTLALALISVFSIQIFGIASMGFFKYAGKFINFKSPIAFFTGILELISEVSKIISFSFRLFGNIFAGEVLLVVMMFLIPFVIPLPFMLLELFVGFIQALVFAMLTLVFIKTATTMHGNEH